MDFRRVSVLSAQPVRVDVEPPSPSRRVGVLASARTRETVCRDTLVSAAISYVVAAAPCARANSSGGMASAAAARAGGWTATTSARSESRFRDLFSWFRRPRDWLMDSVGDEEFCGELIEPLAKNIERGTTAGHREVRARRIPPKWRGPGFCRVSRLLEGPSLPGTDDEP